MTDVQVASAHAIGSEESLAEFRQSLAEIPEMVRTDLHYRNSYVGDLDSEYNPVQFNWRERGATGIESDPRMKQIFFDLEFWIEDVVGAKQIHDGEVQFYKGEVKKWQVINDDAVGVDREEIENMQAAIQAPLPEELEMYKEKHSPPMKLPFNNANVTAWRDEPKAIDSADFDPEFLQIDRASRRKFFIERYEQPKQIGQ
jgi:pterin-4a-carbinolamine dehydratase